MIPDSIIFAAAIAAFFLILFVTDDNRPRVIERDVRKVARIRRLFITRGKKC